MAAWRRRAAPERPPPSGSNAHDARAGSTNSPSAGVRPLLGYAVRYYADGFASSRAALRGSFGFYRAWHATTEQNRQRMQSKLTMPVLAIGGGTSSMNAPEAVMKTVANDVQGLVIPGAGHCADAARTRRPRTAPAVSRAESPERRVRAARRGGTASRAG
jgi:pimeloyl-ACP methyl ester carboxylesterase